MVIFVSENKTITIMEKNELKELLKEILKESGSLSIKVTASDDINVTLLIDDEVIIESNYVDIIGDIKYDVEQLQDKVRCHY